MGELDLFPVNEDCLMINSVRKCNNCGHYEPIDLHVDMGLPSFHCLMKDEVFAAENEALAADCKFWVWYEFMLRE